MTIVERWATSATDGRALLVANIHDDYALWLVKIGGELIRCDDSDTGHLLRLDPDEDETTVIADWQARYGLGFGGRGARGAERRRRWTQTRPRLRCFAAEVH